MESPEATVRYTIRTEVTKTFELDGQWFVHFLGSWESLGLGPDKPDMSVGDAVLITIERLRKCPA